jgi:flagellar hook-basal body complex protein FliE
MLNLKTIKQRLSASNFLKETYSEEEAKVNIEFLNNAHDDVKSLVSEVERLHTALRKLVDAVTEDGTMDSVMIAIFEAEHALSLSVVEEDA